MSDQTMLQMRKTVNDIACLLSNSAIDERRLMLRCHNIKPRIEGSANLVRSTDTS